MIDEGALDLALLICIFSCMICECIVTNLRRHMHDAEEYDNIQDIDVQITADDVLVEPDGLFAEVEERIIDKFLIDQNGIRNCIICSDEIQEIQPILECRQCAKYVGHTACIRQWITTQIEQRHRISCPYCRQL